MQLYKDPRARYSLDIISMYLALLGPKQTWLNSNIRSNERTFECILSKLNFSIISMQKCALISKVEKWHSYLEE